jgi:phage major head subunit gpT-like protein
MAISEQWAELLSPGLYEVFRMQVDELAAESRIPNLFRQEGSGRASEAFLGAGGLSDWTEYEGAIEYDDMEESFKSTFTHKEYVKGFKVERKLVDDDQYGIIKTRPAELAISAMRTREKHAAGVFNNAFASVTGADSVYLCSASHPYSPSNAAVQGNLGTTALSYNAVIDTRKLMREFADDRGELMVVNPDTLLVPPELEDEAWTIVNTMNKPGTGDNDGNFVKSKVRNVITWDYLTDANNWFMLDLRLAKQFLIWLDRVALEFALDPTSDFRLEARYRGYMRYSYGWSDWRWVYGHNVS